MDIRQCGTINVRRLRTERDWSQEESDDLAGVDGASVSGVERRVHNPSILLLEKFAPADARRRGRWAAQARLSQSLYIYVRAVMRIGGGLPPTSGIAGREARRPCSAA